MENILYTDVASKIFIWVNADLDGAASTILLGNIFKNFEYQSIFFGRFEETFTKWSKKNLNNYDKVFIIGMGMTQTTLSKIDDPRLVVISDSGDKLVAFDSIVISEKCTSCCKLLYNKFKTKYDFTINLKKLIAYVDDYNKSELKYEESKYLSAIYRKSGYKKFKIFVERFWSGFDGFTDSEIVMAEAYSNDIASEISNIDIYKGTFKGWSVISVFSSMANNEIAKQLLEKYLVDVVAVINSDLKYISFRKSHDSPADIKYMAENLCNGGGSEYRSGGSITPKFLELSETFKKYD